MCLKYTFFVGSLVNWFPFVVIYFLMHVKTKIFKFYMEYNVQKLWWRFWNGVFVISQMVKEIRYTAKTIFCCFLSNFECTYLTKSLETIIWNLYVFPYKLTEVFLFLKSSTPALHFDFLFSLVNVEWNWHLNSHWAKDCLILKIVLNFLGAHTYTYTYIQTYACMLILCIFLYSKAKLPVPLLLFYLTLIQLLMFCAMISLQA